MGEVRLTLAHRAMAGDWTDNEILMIAKSRLTLSVSKYAVRDKKILDGARRLERKGKLRFLCEDSGRLYYRAIES